MHDYQWPLIMIAVILIAIDINSRRCHFGSEIIDDNNKVMSAIIKILIIVISYNYISLSLKITFKNSMLTFVVHNNKDDSFEIERERGRKRKKERKSVVWKME